MLCFHRGALHCCIAPGVDKNVLLELCIHIKVGYCRVISFLPCSPLGSPFFTVLVSASQLAVSWRGKCIEEKGVWGRLPQLKAWRGLSTSFSPVGHLQGHNASVCLGGSHGSSSNINKGSGMNELSAWRPPQSSSGHMLQGSWLASPHQPSATNLGLRKQMRNEAAHETPKAGCWSRWSWETWLSQLRYAFVSCVQMSYRGLASAVWWNWQSFTVALTALRATFTVWQWLFPPHLPRVCSLVFNCIIYCFTEHEASPSATDSDHTPKALLLWKISLHSQA